MDKGQDKIIYNKIRHFSEDFKKLKIQELEQKQVTIAKLVSLYGVSRSGIYNWVHKYSRQYNKTTRLVVELESESIKTDRLLKRVAELERIVGQKQLEIDLLNKFIEVSSEELGIDLKKSSCMKSLNGSGQTKINTPGV
jgi:transposase